MGNKDKIYDIINEVRSNLCDDKEGFEEFERGANIACNHIMIKIRDAKRGN